jgi:hypothetical protein
MKNIQETKNLLTDIITEFGRLDNISLQTERIYEMLSLVANRTDLTYVKRIENYTAKDLHIVKDENDLYCIVKNPFEEDEQFMFVDFVTAEDAQEFIDNKRKTHEDFYSFVKDNDGLF